MCTIVVCHHIDRVCVRLAHFLKLISHRLYVIVSRDRCVFVFVLLYFYCDYGKIKCAWARSLVDTVLTAIGFVCGASNRIVWTWPHICIFFISSEIKKKTDQWIWNSDQLANLKTTMVPAYRHNRRRRWSSPLQCSKRCVLLSSLHHLRQSSFASIELLFGHVIHRILAHAIHTFRDAYKTQALYNFKEW